MLFDPVEMLIIIN